MIDLIDLDEASRYVWDHEFRLLHTHHWADNDVGQVNYLLRTYNPRGHVLDVGCGFGEVTRLMRGLGCRAEFTLLNISRYQLSKCPREFRRVHGCAEMLPFEANHFSGVMMNSALLNFDRGAALEEAHRVVGPGGMLMLSDVVIPVAERETYDAPAMRKEMHAHVTSAFKFIKDIYNADFRIRAFNIPRDATVHHIYNVADKALVDRLFKPLRPLILVAEAV